MNAKSLSALDGLLAFPLIEALMGRRARRFFPRRFHTRWTACLYLAPRGTAAERTRTDAGSHGGRGQYWLALYDHT